MTRDHVVLEQTELILTDDERSIVAFIRTLAIDRAEVLRRLSTPMSDPVLPGGQELQANLSAVAPDMLDPGKSGETA
jgi:hypothetical protein